MSHLHSVHDTDPLFRIDPKSRDITYDGIDPLVLIQNDHNSEHYTFEIPRHVDGHDMMQCNSVQIHYMNIDADTGGRNPGVYVIKDLRLSNDDEDVVIGSWTISQNATRLAGSLVFAIRFACMTGSTIDYAWNTNPYSDVRVSSGIYNGDEVVVQHADILESWHQELLGAGTSSINDINEAKTKAIEEINNHISNVDAAVDVILAMQESLIGGDE